MNIFATYKSPIDSAKVLDDKRVIKMVLESAQMLSTAMHVLGVPGAPYRKTHENHPCAVWCRQNQCNYLWLLDHFLALCSEYSRRYHRVHKCQQYYEVFAKAGYYVPDGSPTPFPNCTKFKDIEDVHKAYRAALVDKWKNDKRPPKWTNSKPPIWEI